MRKILYSAEWQDMGLAEFGNIIADALLSGGDKIEMDVSYGPTEIITIEITRPESEQEARNRHNLQCIVDKVADEIFAEIIPHM